MYPLVFLFGVAAWVCWVKWLQGASWKWYATTAAAFLLAAASNESVCAVAVLMLLPVAFDRRLWRRGLTGAVPFLLIATAYMIWLMTGRVALAAAVFAFRSMASCSAQQLVAASLCLGFGSGSGLTVGRQAFGSRRGYCGIGLDDCRPAAVLFFDLHASGA